MLSPVPMPRDRLACRSDAALNARATFARSNRGYTAAAPRSAGWRSCRRGSTRSEEHTSELQSLMRISYAVFCLKKKKNRQNTHSTQSRKKEQTTTVQHSKRHPD